MKKESRSASGLADFIKERRKRSIPADPAARIRLAIQLSELCYKLKNACLISSSK